MHFLRLDVADVQDPNLLRAAVVGALHFPVEQTGVVGRQPQIVLRNAPVRNVIVDARAARTLDLLLVGEVEQVAAVVVAPHERDILRDLQPGTIDVQHFLVRHEDLRDLVGFFAGLPFDDDALVGDDLREGFALFVERLRAVHAPVMHAAHANGVDVLETPDLREAVFEELQHVVLVRNVVVLALAAHFPLAVHVAVHRLAVRGADHDAVPVGGFGIALHHVERDGAAVHGRPERVRLQAEQQLEDLRVGLRADRKHLRRFLRDFGIDQVRRFRLERLRRPRREAPVLVVDEDAAVFDRGSLRGAERLRQGEGIAFFRRDVRPPFVGRDAEHPGKFDDAVSRAALVRTCDHEPRLAVFVHDGELERFRAVVLLDLPALEIRFEQGRIRSADHDVGVRRVRADFKFRVQHVRRIAFQQVERDADGFGFPVRSGSMDGLAFHELEVSGGKSDGGHEQYSYQLFFHG